MTNPFNMLDETEKEDATRYDELYQREKQLRQWAEEALQANDMALYTALCDIARQYYWQRVELVVY